jgi:hypothetical protein
MAERVAVHEGRNGVTHDLFDLRVRGVMAAHVEGAARQVVWIIAESGEPVVRGPRLDNLLGKGTPYRSCYFALYAFNPVRRRTAA